MSSLSRPGRVITFYSYKGGSGRSMALSNFAWILAAAGKSVLMIDWDLEAPGLHRYFKPFLIDHELSSSDGLMDVIDTYACEVIKPLENNERLAPDWWWPLADIRERVLSVDFEHFPPGGKIDLLAAGRQSPTYAVKVNAFNWQNFYDRLGGGGFLGRMMADAQSEYDYVLVDSRTGVSDTAGICTVQLPDTLVVCFTYNNQSIKGAAAVAASAQAQQAEQGLIREQQTPPALQPGAVQDSRKPFRIFPVPMRVDGNETDRLALRRTFAREVFGSMLAGYSAADKERYWSRVEVPHQAFYAYEEVLAAFKDDPDDPKSVLSAFARMADYLTEGEVSEYNLPVEPLVRQALLEAFAETPQTAVARQASAEAAKESEEQALIRRADALIVGLERAERELARSLLCRLVRIGKADEGGRNYPIRVAISDFVDEQQPLLSRLAQGALLTISTEAWPALGRAAVPEQVVSLVDDRLVAQWPLLERWLAEDKEFLRWRQQLRDYRNDWSRTQERAALISGSLLGEAVLWSHKRPSDLNLAEHEFIRASVAAAEELERSMSAQESTVSYASASHNKLPKFSSGRRAAIGVAVASAVLGIPALVLIRSKPAGQTKSPPSPPTVNLVGSSSSDAQKIAQSLGISLVMVDADTMTEQAFVDGFVVAQQADATGRVFHLTIATKTIPVPLVIGQKLSSASELLQESGFQLQKGAPGSSNDSKVAPGTVIAQSPDPGTMVRPGTTVTLRIAEQSAAIGSDALRGFKVAIFFYDDDKHGGELAEQIAVYLRKANFAGTIDRRPSTAKFMTEAYPPQTVEVRYEPAGEEAAANVLLSIVTQVPGIGRARKLPVSTKTDKYLSVFIPRST